MTPRWLYLLNRGKGNARLFSNTDISPRETLEGPEGVKWELGLACYCIGKMGFWLLGLGFESEKKAKMGMGLVFC